MSQPLTDDQLHQVAAAMTIEYGRDQANDRMGIGEMLEDSAAEIGAELVVEEITVSEFDAMTERIAHLITTANITVEWDGSPLSIFSEANPVETP